MNRILVTGANGQLGNEMRRLAGGKNGKDCYIFTDIAELDITDLDAVRRYVADEKISVVVNCAAYTNVDKAEEDEGTADRINRLAVENLAVPLFTFQLIMCSAETGICLTGRMNRPIRWVLTAGRSWQENRL